MRRHDSGLTGILLVDKPAGWTSHDVVAKVRGITGQRRIGHTGTLDPMATGLLVLCLGKATRLVEYITSHDKAYIGRVRLGVATTTDDANGEVVATGTPPPVDDALLRHLEQQFSGDILQTPPAYSAVKVAGERAYRAARKGRLHQLQPRPVRVHALSLRPAAEDSLDIALRCGSGTYVRSIARDLGVELGCGAHLAELRRTRSGPFAVADAWTVEQLAAASAVGLFNDLLLPADEGTTGFAAAIVSAPAAAAVAAGRPHEVRETGSDGHVRVYAANGQFVGIGSIQDGNRLVPMKVLTL